MAEMSHTPAPSSDPLVGEVRLKVPLPVLIPLAAVAFIALATVGLSRVLLAVPPEIATMIALVTATNVLIACAVVASGRVSTSSLPQLAIVVLYPVIVGIVLAQIGVGESGGEGEPAAPTASGPNAIVAEGTQFDKTELTFDAGEETNFEFTNKDPVEHNLAIYESESDAEAQSNPLFQGELISDGSTTYQIPPLDEGEFAFQCDVHPSMAGSVAVEAAAAPAGEGGNGGSGPKSGGGGKSGEGGKSGGGKSGDKGG